MWDAGTSSKLPLAAHKYGLYSQIERETAEEARLHGTRSCAMLASLIAVISPGYPCVSQSTEAGANILHGLSRSNYVQVIYGH
jgi:hypothetical protein